jgi:pyruvate dehydrogenase kinase 2/3/4
MLKSQIFEYSKRKATAVSLRDLYRYNKVFDPVQRVRNAQFLYKELPVRFAQRIEELSSLPFGLSNKKPIGDVKKTFEKCFEKIVACKFPTTLEDDDKFTEVLKTIVTDGGVVIQNMALGVIEFREELGNNVTPEMNWTIDHYLNRFFMSRIGHRFLIDHHISGRNNKEGYSGILQSNCSPLEVAKYAAEETRYLCHSYYGIAPEVNIICPHPKETFTYVPSHLHYILCELLKNSLRATVEFHGYDTDPLPPVEVVIARGKTDITVKISDRGGGIPFDKVPLIWTYCLTTTASQKFKSASLDLINSQSTAISGYGCGLPLARLYAQYFGGGLDLKSMEGYGTDAYCHLNRLGNSCENLPLDVQRSPAERDSSIGFSEAVKLHASWTKASDRYREIVG